MWGFMYLVELFGNMGSSFADRNQANDPRGDPYSHHIPHQPYILDVVVSF